MAENLGAPPRPGVDYDRFAYFVILGLDPGTYPL